MNIKWGAISEIEKSKFEQMNETDRFVFFLCKQLGSPYGWGKENPVSSDCSGAVCLALYAATGLLIRTTADDLFKRIFTRVNPRQTDIRAVFFVTKKNKKHGYRTVAAGTAVHVAGFLSDGVILNSQTPGARIRRITDVSDDYQREGHDVYIRGLNREALARIAGEGNTRYGLDSELSRFFDIES